MYRRILTGVIAQGRTKPFLEAMRANNRHQEERGIRARTTVWGAMTGQTNSVLIASDFNTLDELEKFTDLPRRTRPSRAFAGPSVRDDSEATQSRSIVFRTTRGIDFEQRRPNRGATCARLQGKCRRAAARVRDVHVTGVGYRQRGIEAHTSVWSAVTGQTSGVSIVAEFNSLIELEKFDEITVRDAEFGRLRAATRSTMVFLTSEVELMRNLL
jgi:hypothetical protein